MELLLVFMLIGVVWGMFSHSVDWRHYAVLAAGAAVLAFLYQVSVGAW
jgi:hypothetical protein